MSARDDLLFEIGTEELPPMALSRLAQALAKGVEAGLKQAKLEFTRIDSFASPRRLAFIVKDLVAEQPDVNSERRGPAIAAAFDEAGNPSKALQGFARSCGADVNDLEKLETDKVAWFVYRSLIKGKSLAELLPDIIKQSLSKLPIPKRMRWGDLGETFVRPVHWLILMYGDQVLPYTQFGQSANNQSYGHRFHHPQAVKIKRPADYLSALEKARVLADIDVRKKRVVAAINTAANEAGGEAVIDNELLELITSIVEWPSPILGQFDNTFLELPEPVIVAVLKGHQKCFHVKKGGKLLPYFISISNVDSSNPAVVISGNERVVKARLADATFFFKKDLKAPLSELVDGLKNVVFQHKLGSVYDKMKNVRGLAKNIASAQGFSSETCAALEQAASLCKADLQSHMVFEFPELQGEMGYQYAQRAPNNLPDNVAIALKEYYYPRFSGDELPASEISQSLALADRIDSIAALFSIGQAPTGERDPFALRRAVLGVIRIVVEKSLDLDLTQLFTAALNQLPNTFDTSKVLKEIDGFVRGRLRGYYLDQGVSHDTYEAVDSVRHWQSECQPYDIDRRIKAISVFRLQPEAAALAAANKRITNILKKSDVDSNIDQTIDPSLLEDNSEKALHSQVQSLAVTIAPLIKARDYEKVLSQLSTLKDSIDIFFDQVMVMCDDEKVKNNRIALLCQTRNLFLKVADISCLQL
ncbi:MAG: glycine--tRNA ligase subunit beta [Gammaproteobacteria bacterium]|nr:glycine--tRNA ligase subunit beta [Gammaproteobacteria bacterium]